MKCRKADIRKYGEQDMPYEVWAYEANDKAMITSLMEKLHNDPEIDVVLMDSPGSLKTEGLIPLFVNSDIIIVPFHYDLVTVPSLDMQATIVTPVFDKVYQSIFDTLQPIREKELKGIQLTENLNPKPKKKKKYDPNIVRTKSASLMRNI